ncbi:MAG: sulfur oxidation c-type cytochrome SoxX [Hyphomicrobiaceae bacterium]
MRRHAWIVALAGTAMLAAAALPGPLAAQDKAAKATAKATAEAKPAAPAKKAKDRCKDGEPAEVAKYTVSKGKNLPASIDKPLASAAGDANRGLGWMAHRRLGNCLACHEISKVEELAKKQGQIEVKTLDGKTAKMPLGVHGHIGPTLDGVAERYTEGELRMLVVNPKKIFPETIMPAFHRNSGFTTVHPDCEGLSILSAAQVEDVVSFLKTLKE